MSVSEAGCELNIHVVMDNVMIIEDIKNSALSVNSSEKSVGNLSGPSKSWKPLLLFIPLRLGISDINPVYFTDLKVWINY